MNRAIVLCSGGLDSVTAAYALRSQHNYYDLILLFFDYGQRNLQGEKQAVRFFKKQLNTRLCELSLNLQKDISLSLLMSNLPHTHLTTFDLSDTKKESAKWYIPCRNLILLSYAMSYAESLFIKEKKRYNLAVGFKNEGKEPFPDATKEFVKKFSSLANFATFTKPKILAPLLKLDKEDIILLAKQLNVPMQKTWSCYVGKRQQCGTCLACAQRKAGFYWANVPDSTKYSNLT